MQCSQLYSTTPVSDIPQADYINAVIRFQTQLSIEELHTRLKAIEVLFGKKERKIKNAPRFLDIDILFYGEEVIETQELSIPHPRWKERLFVVRPLRDIISHLSVPTARGVVVVDLNKLCEELQRLYNHYVEVFQGVSV